MRSTHSRFCVVFVCGEPGAGKSYICSVDVLDRLVSSKVGILTNLPLNVAEITRRAAEETGEPAESFAARIELIPPQTLADWQNGIGGPWELKGNGRDLLLDEVHRFAPSAGGAERGKQWNDFLGEPRHAGWQRLVFITQDQSKVHTAIKVHTGVRFELTTTESVRDPYAGIPLAAWYELAASFTGRYVAPVLLAEYGRQKGALVCRHKEWFVLKEKNFALYNSYVAAGGGAVEGECEPRQYQYQTRPTWWPVKADGKFVLPVYAWFLTRFGHRLIIPFTSATVALWLTLGGGLLTMFNAAGDAMEKAIAEKKLEAGDPQEVEELITEHVPASPEAFAEVLPRLNDADRSAANAWVEHQADIERELREEVDQLKAENQELAGKLLTEKKLVAIHDGITWWDSGEQVAVGERLEGEGPEIETIDETRRIIALVGGRRVRLGGVLRYRETPAEFDPRLERGLQAGGAAGTGPGTGAQRETDQPLR